MEFQADATISDATIGTEQSYPLARFGSLLVKNISTSIRL